MKIISLVLILVLSGVSVYARESKRFESNNSNNSVISIGNDFVFVKTQEPRGVSYIQNLKNMMMYDSELQSIYYDETRKLPDGNLLLANNQRLNTRTLEVTSYPLTTLFDVYLKYKDNQYLALNSSSYCIFELAKGCVNGAVRLPRAFPSGVIYQLADDEQTSTLFFDYSGIRRIIKFQKQDLSWKEIAAVAVPATHNQWLATLADPDTVLLLTANQYNMAAPSIIYSVDLKTGKYKTTTLEQAFSTLNYLKLVDGQVLIFGTETVACTGSCSRDKVLAVMLDLATFKKVKEISSNFQYRFASTYAKNTPNLNTTVEMADGRLAVVGSHYIQTKNFHESFSFKTLEFSANDPSVIIKNICNKQKEIMPYLANYFTNRGCGDIAIDELSVITRLDLAWKNLKYFSLADVEGFNNLINLNLSYNSITTIDDDVLAQLTGLTSLSLFDNPISATDKARIRSKLPNTRVTF